jgi:hypothetical protein
LFCIWPGVLVDAPGAMLPGEPTVPDEPEDAPVLEPLSEPIEDEPPVLAPPALEPPVLAPPMTIHWMRQMPAPRKA